MRKTAESVLEDAREKDEPVFVLRGQDECAIEAIQAYLVACVSQRCDPFHISGVHDILRDFVQFSEDHPGRMKKPD